MKEPTTIKGFLSLMALVQSIQVSTLKGFDLLSENDQQLLLFMKADIDNNLNEMTP